MIRVVGVRFKKAGKVYYFDPTELPIAAGCKVVVETARGIEYGDVAIGPKDVDESQVVQPLKKVIRLGTDADAIKVSENRKREKEAFGLAQKKIDDHKLDMNLVDVEYTFDASKIIFYFTAEGRIDFRELVKDLASVFRTRIEMRQIGVRDEAKLLGGIGPCGRILCCTSFLGDFAPVSIRMAKDQNLSLNPSKISGLCGRLMCCLRYEQETYEAAKKDPTLAPSYVPPPMEAVAGYLAEDLDDAPPARPGWWKNESGYSARIAQALDAEPAPRERGERSGEASGRPSPTQPPRPKMKQRQRSDAPADTRAQRPQGQPPVGKQQRPPGASGQGGQQGQQAGARQQGQRPQGAQAKAPQTAAKPQGQQQRPKGQRPQGQAQQQAQQQQHVKAQRGPEQGQQGARSNAPSDGARPTAPVEGAQLEKASSASRRRRHRRPRSQGSGENQATGSQPS